jgi:putative FmdB family regulatory protein
MPLFDFRCASCGHVFEALVRKDTALVCASCGGADLERLVTLPFAKTEGTKALSMQAAKRRDQAQAKDRAHEQRKYEQSHND